MTLLDKRVAEIELRCTQSGKALLESLSSYALYPKVIHILERTTGVVSYRDIEEAVIRVGCPRAKGVSEKLPDSRPRLRLIRLAW